MRRIITGLKARDPKKREEYILNCLINGMDLWFVNISANKIIYMDYNFVNSAGKFNVGVTNNMSDYSFEFVLKEVTLFDKDDSDKDEEDYGEF